MTVDQARRKTSIATVCLSGTLEDKLVAAGHAGFDGIELFEPDLLGCPARPKDIKRRCEELGLQIFLYQPFRDLDSTDDEQFERNLTRLDRKFDVMAELGVDLVLLCSNASDDAVTDIDILAEQLRAAGDLALRRGMRIAYEALAWGTEVSLWQQSWDAVRAADHPAVGLCLDSFHVLSRTPSPAGIENIAEDKIFFLQLADAPHKDMDILQWSRHYRLFPGQGAFDLTSFTTAVIDAGYTGPLSLEVFNDVFRQASPVRTAVDAARSLAALETSMSEREPTPPTEMAFVEIAVTPTELSMTEHTLTALQFVRAATHRTKNVTVWTQAEATILLNVTTDAYDEDDTSQIAAIAFATMESAAMTELSHVLRAAPQPRVVGPDEANIPAVAAPDGTSIFFLDRDDRHTSWRRDFISAADVAPPGLSSSITHIDHVSVTAPFDRFDECVLFYRSMLGMSTSDVAEHPGPYGLVRSHLLRTEQPAGFGVSLDSSVLRRGRWSPGVDKPQHVAFCTDNLVEMLAQLPAGAPILSIPANYYLDLRARFDLAEDFLATLRKHNILYDRNATGEYLHAYTTLVGTQLYFEFIERRGDYRGRPTIDGSIRMAAHVAARRGGRESQRTQGRRWRSGLM